MQNKGRAQGNESSPETQSFAAGSDKTAGQRVSSSEILSHR